MGKQLYIGLAVEGNTDMRFLKGVVHRTFLRIVYEKSEQEVDVEVFELNTPKYGKTFPEFVEAASREGVEKCGILILTVHADSDKETLQERLEDKFIPAQRQLETLDADLYCKVMTPVIPIRMIESWMMADKDVLKEEIGTSLSDSTLGLHRSPELVADPKSLIESAITIAQQNLPKKRRKMTIGDLYGIMGDEISLESLLRLPSFRAFWDAATEALKRIHYIN